MWRKFSLVMSALVILLTISYSLAAAQTGGGFNLTWSTVDGGGGVSTGGQASRVAALEQEVQQLRQQFDELSAQFAEFRRQFE